MIVKKERKARVKYDSQYFKRLVHFFCSRFKNQFRFKELNYRQNSIIFDLLMKNNRIGCCLIEKNKDYNNLYFDDYIEVEVIGKYINGYVDNKVIQFPNLDNYLGTILQFRVDKDAVVGVLDLEHPDGYFVSMMETITYFAKELAILKFKIDVIKDQITPQYFIYLTGKNDANIKNVKDFYDLENNIIMVNDAETFKHKPIEPVASDASANLEKLIIHKQELLKELYTFLGFESSQQIAKKEHLITDEVEPEVVTSRSYKQIFKDCLQGFGNRVGEVLGLPLTLIVADDIVMEQKLLQDKSHSDFLNSTNSKGTSAFGAAGAGYSSPSGTKGKNVSMALKTPNNSLGGGDTSNPYNGNGFKPLPGPGSNMPGQIDTPINSSLNFTNNETKKKKPEKERSFEEIMASIGALLGGFSLRNNREINDFINQHQNNFDHDLINERNRQAAEQFERENFYRLRFERMIRDQDLIHQNREVADDVFFRVGNEIANVFHRFHRDYVLRLSNHYSRYYGIDLTAEQINDFFIEATRFLQSVRTNNFEFMGRPGADYELIHQSLAIPAEFISSYDQNFEIVSGFRNFYERMVAVYPGLEVWQAEIITYDAITLNDFIAEHYQLEILKDFKEFSNLAISNPDNLALINDPGFSLEKLFIHYQNSFEILGEVVNSFPSDMLQIAAGSSVTLAAIIRRFLDLMPNTGTTLNLVGYPHVRAEPSTAFSVFAFAFLSILGYLGAKEGVEKLGKLNLKALNEKLKERGTEYYNALYERIANEAKEKLKFFAEFNQKRYEKFIKEEATKLQFEKFMETEIKGKIMKQTIEDKKKAYFDLINKRHKQLRTERDEYYEGLKQFHDSYLRYMRTSFWQRNGEDLGYSGAYVERIRREVGVYRDLYENTLDDFPFIPSIKDALTLEAMNKYRKETFKYKWPHIKYYEPDMPRRQASYGYNRGRGW